MMAIRLIAKNIICIILTVTWTSSCFAQEIEDIGLEKILKLCQANNLLVEETRLRSELANSEADIARSWWLPDIYAGLQTHQQWGASMNTDGKFALDNQRDNLWLGAGFDLEWDFGNAIHSAKAKNYEAKSEYYKGLALKNILVLDAVKYYYALLSSQHKMEAYRQLYVQADTLTKQIKTMVDAGLSYESDWLISKSNTNHHKIEELKAKSEWQNNSIKLKELLNINQEKELVCKDPMLIPAKWIEEKNVLGTNKKIKRPEIEAMESAILAIKEQNKLDNLALLFPSLRLNGYLSQFGDLNNEITPLDPIQFPNTDQLYPTQNLDASLMWNIPLDNVFSKGKRTRNKLRLSLADNKIEQAEAMVSQEITTARGNMESASLQLRLAEESVELSSASLQQTFDRERAGIIRPMEIMQAQEVFIKAKLDHIEAVSLYNLSAYQLYLALGNQF